MTDTAIMQGMIDTVLARLPDELAVLFLPIQTIGKSNEHLRSKGTITFSAENLLRTWFEIGEAVHRAGLRKLVIVNSHGGNAEVIAVLARELRVRLDMLAVTSQWRRFGLPPNTYAAYDATYGIHAGDIEASLMLHFRPDLVDMSKAKLFRPGPPRSRNSSRIWADRHPRRRSAGLHPILIPTAQLATPRLEPRKRARSPQNFKRTDLSRCCETWPASRSRTGSAPK